MPYAPHLFCPDFQGRSDEQLAQEIILQAEGISKRFAGIVALDQVRLELRKGEVHALVGANGAGKSTLIKILTGAYQKDAGSIRLDGHEIEIHSTIDARQKGISAVYQEFSLFNDLTVGENIYMGKFPQARRTRKIDWKTVYLEAAKYLHMIETPIDPREKVGNLSVGQKQLVEIAKALSDQSRVLILDEPTAALTDNDIEGLFQVIRNLQKHGISIIYVSHRLEELPQICNRVSVYRDGHYIKTLDITDAPKSVIVENMVGQNYVPTERQNFSRPDVIMNVNDFSSGKKFQHISFNLHRGEVLGIAGLAGAGRTELLRAIFGADPRDSGSIMVEGEPVEIRSPIDAKKAGLGFITEDRKEEGLILDHDIKTNISLTILRHLCPGFYLNQRKESAIACDYIEKLKIKTSGPCQLVRDLSGGNQQKVVVSKWLATRPRVLLMDEPTRGIDVGSKSQIYQLIQELARQGIGIIVVSSEIPEILDISNRILVMAAGKMTALIDNDGVSQEQILDLATTKNHIRKGEIDCE
jgi:ribose transport system ATP-binding protein